MTQNNHSTPRRYWRSLDELQKTPEFEQFLHREFPVAASEYPEGVSRRRWLQLMGASLAMTGAVGCRYPEEIIAPFVVRPEGRVPGEQYARATNFQWADRVHHLLVTCVDGRPLKIEGNPDHPASNGGTDHYVQASILQLYDPDRCDSVRQVQGDKREEVDWEAFDRYASGLARSGGKLAVLMPPTASPSLIRLLGEMRQRMPGTSVCVYDPVGQGAAVDAVRMATGKAGRIHYRLAPATVMVDVGADLLGRHSGFVHNARGYAEGRNPGEGSMSRLYVVEPGFSETGMTADSRLALRPSQLKPFLGELERAIDALLASETHVHDDVEGEQAFDQLPPAERVSRFIEVLAHDLVDAAGQSLVAVGESLGSEAVAAGLRINAKLKNIGTTIEISNWLEGQLGETISLETLVADIENGQVDGLVILGGNPVYTAPSNIDLASAIGRLDHSIYLGEYDDETGAACRWSLPDVHPLESWGDAIGDYGHYGVCQPHILPLLGGRSAIELLATLLELEEREGQQIVRRTADEIAGEPLSQRRWAKLLHDGFDQQLTLASDPVEVAVAGEPFPGTPVMLNREQVEAEDFELRDQIDAYFVPSDGLFDGRFANNAWLQEMPQSLTKLTWDNAALMNPVTAEAIGVRHGVKVALQDGDTRVELPVFVIPGMAVGAVVVPYGYGRSRVGAVGGHEELEVASVGVDVSPLRKTGTMSMALAIRARPRPRDEYPLATTQNHWAIDDLGREETEDRSYQLVREGTYELFKVLPEFAGLLGVHSPGTGSLWQEPIDEIEQQDPDLPQWGMAIDLSKCMGCNACVIACQSENNVPIVGKEQVMMGREMHWLRIDRYFQGDEDHAEVVQEPMLCMHCETAPCEQVCPVAATVHTDDGINAMAYNRCIGTRYCANNCPYKVRRFNYFNWNEGIGVGYGIRAYNNTIENANRQLQQLVLNPEVTVRGRGVMEKCTYCVQRVEAGKIAARRDGGRPIRDGEVKTACQTACPTQAIEFGNVGDPNSLVSKAKRDPRNYAMLDQLNVSPRTTYLARIGNPHPRLMTARQLEDLVELPKKAAQHHGGHGEDHGSEHGEGHAGDEHHGEHGAQDESHAESGAESAAH